MQLRFLSAVALLLVAQPLGAQLPTPQGWSWTLDSPARHVNATDVVPAGAFGFVEMAPGWHVTTGPGALLHHPRQSTDGRFTLESRLVLFPGTGPAEYGVFVGGRDLEAAGRVWVAFVVRRDGSAAVMRHQDGRTDLVTPWTPHAAIKGGPEGGANTVRVTVDAAVVFQVNDSTIASYPRGQVPTDGTFGFRIGPELNLHITSLDVTHRFAPARTGR